MARRRASVVKLRELVARWIVREQETIANLKGATNPQLITLMNEATGRLLALRAVLDGLHGDYMSLEIYSEDISKPPPWEW